MQTTRDATGQFVAVVALWRWAAATAVRELVLVGLVGSCSVHNNERTVITSKQRISCLNLV